MGGDIKDSHLLVGKMALTDSHRRRLANQAKFHAPALSDVEDLDLFLDGREMMRMSQLMFMH